MPLTPEQVRARFVDEGVTVTDWARLHGFRREIVYALLSGRTRGSRGQSHQAAIALGLKGKCLPRLLAEGRRDTPGVVEAMQGENVTNQPTNNDGGDSQ